jgi:3-hydroxyisobutyrate dehydrogenase
MLAGDDDTGRAVAPLFARMCGQVVAEMQGLDLGRFREVVDGGQMASSIFRVKTPKLLAHDCTAQAAAADGLKNNELVVQAARHADIASPLLDACHALCGETAARYAAGPGHSPATPMQRVRVLDASTSVTAADWSRV